MRGNRMRGQRGENSAPFPTFVGIVDTSRHVNTRMWVRSWSKLNSHEALDENRVGGQPLVGCRIRVRVTGLMSSRLPRPEGVWDRIWSPVWPPVFARACSPSMREVYDVMPLACHLHRTLVFPRQEPGGDGEREAAAMRQPVPSTAFHHPSRRRGNMLEAWLELPQRRGLHRRITER